MSRRQLSPLDVLETRVARLAAALAALTPAGGVRARSPGASAPPAAGPPATPGPALPEEPGKGLAPQPPAR